MQSAVIVISAIFAVFWGLAASSDVLPQQRERRAVPEDLAEFEPEGWEEEQDQGLGGAFGSDELVKRIADNDFAAMRHREKSNSLRRSILLQAMKEMLARAGKRSVSEKRSLAQNDFMQAKHQLAQDKLNRINLNKMLYAFGKR